MNNMGIEWTPADKSKGKEFDLLEHYFLELGKEAISMNHYDLYKKCSFTDMHLTPMMWKQFLTDPHVVEYIASEFDAIKSSELRKIIMDINSSKSVGQAQIINSLSKMLEGSDKKKEGPAFVYMYVPLTDQQAQAPNVKVLEKDPFIVEGI